MRESRCLQNIVISSPDNRYQNFWMFWKVRDRQFFITWYITRYFDKEAKWATISMEINKILEWLLKNVITEFLYIVLLYSVFRRVILFISIGYLSQNVNFVQPFRKFIDFQWNCCSLCLFTEKSREVSRDITWYKSHI